MTELYLNKLRLSKMIFFLFPKNSSANRHLSGTILLDTAQTLNKVANSTLKTLQSKHDKENIKWLQTDRGGGANVLLTVFTEAVSMLNLAYITVCIWLLLEMNMYRVNDMAMICSVFLTKDNIQAKTSLSLVNSRWYTWKIVQSIRNCTPLICYCIFLNDPLCLEK